MIFEQTVKNNTIASVKLSVRFPAISNLHNNIAIKRINAFYKKTAIKLQCHCRKVHITGANDFYCSGDFTVTYSNNDILSIVRSVREKIDETAYPECLYAETWNMQNGIPLSLSYFTKSENISSLINRSHPLYEYDKIINTHELKSMCKHFHRSNFFLSDDNICIFFNPSTFLPNTDSIRLFTAELSSDTFN